MKQSPAQDYELEAGRLRALALVASSLEARQELLRVASMYEVLARRVEDPMAFGGQRGPATDAASE